MCRNDSAKSTMIPTRQRRQKRDKEGQYVLLPSKNTSPSKKKPKKQSKALQKHGKNSQSGGIEAMIPSLLGVGVLIFAVMAQRGFRGRASVAGIDLGTTNSVICVQAQSKAVGDIDCIEDPETGSPIIPSVVAFLQPHERKVGPSSKIKSLLIPHPSHVVVGQRAKHRIESHPNHTLYNAKRVLGRPITDSAITDLRHEVEFQIEGAGHDDDTKTNEVVFRVDDFSIPPTQVGSYIVNHLIEILILRNPDRHNKIGFTWIKQLQCRVWKTLGSFFIREIANHFITNHPYDILLIFGHGLGMYITSHVMRSKIRWFLQTIENEINSIF